MECSNLHKTFWFIKFLSPYLELFEFEINKWILDHPVQQSWQVASVTLRLTFPNGLRIFTCTHKYGGRRRKKRKKPRVSDFWNETLTKNSRGWCSLFRQPSILNYWIIHFGKYIFSLNCHFCAFLLRLSLCLYLFNIDIGSNQKVDILQNNDCLS